MFNLKNNYAKNLKIGLNKKSGHNSHGKITVYHHGCVHKICYLIIYFKCKNTYGSVVAIMPDPNRTSMIALIFNSTTKQYFYRLAPHQLHIGDKIRTYSCFDIHKAREIHIGDTMPLYNIPLNVPIHNIELYPGHGGNLVRSAGNFAYILKKDNYLTGFAYIKLNNKRIKKLPLLCLATIGKLSNVYHDLINYQKAGTIRNLNRRPTVRGVAMNPIDHPHGGGEGKTSGGRVSVTPWGLITKGYKTVKNKRHEE